MRHILVIIIVVHLLLLPVRAVEFTAPTVPEAGQRYMPDETENLGEGLLYVIRAALQTIHPSIAEAVRTCASLVIVSLLVAMLINVSPQVQNVVTMAGVAVTGVMVLQPIKSLVRLGIDTVTQLSQYGKLLLPVMTGALAAQGSVTKSGTIYAATVFFDALLSTAVARLLSPMIYIFICVGIAGKLLHQSMLDNLKSSVKSLMTWGLKLILYVFTGYISITGVVSGTTDAVMLKATKLTISSMVPVVGGILSDASEAILVSAGLMKNTAGIYGMLALISVAIGPFLELGVQYILLKTCSGICQMFGTPKIAGVIKDFSDSMGLILAMIGTVCVILLISIICFMRGSA